MSSCRFHTASPVAFGSGNPEQDLKDIVEPAVNGESILKGGEGDSGKGSSYDDWRSLTKGRTAISENLAET